MKIGIVFYPNSGNLGDDVQTIAMMELVQRLEPKAEVELVDREKLNDSSLKELDGVIVSGWFMDEPSNWPPNNENILFTSFHVNSQNGASEHLQSEDHVEFYKKHEPIGCRDFGTKERFDEIGVKAFVSGCATLTLQRPKEESEGHIVAVDPFQKVEKSEFFQRRQLSKLLSVEDQEKCIFLMNETGKLSTKSVEQRFKNAHDYLTTLSRARLVITSRIHAALPSVALGVPTFFILAGYDRDKSHQDRFEGIITLFNVIEQSKFRFLSRKRWSKLFRKTGLNWLLDKSDYRHVLKEAETNQKPLPPTKALEYVSLIEGQVEQFLKATPGQEMKA